MDMMQQILKELKAINKRLDSIEGRENTLMTTAEAAKYIGLSVHSIYKLSSTSNPVLSYTTIRGKKLFYKAELDSYLTKNKVRGIAA